MIQPEKGREEKVIFLNAHVNYFGIKMLRNTRSGPINTSARQDCSTPDQIGTEASGSHLHDDPMYPISHRFSWRSDCLGQSYS